MSPLQEEIRNSYSLRLLSGELANRLREVAAGIDRDDEVGICENVDSGCHARHFLTRVFEDLGLNPFFPHEDVGTYRLSGKWKWERGERRCAFAIRIAEYLEATVAVKPRGAPCSP